MLFLADIQLDILCLCAHTDDHTGVYLLSGSDKQCSAVLCREEAVCHALAGLEGDEGTGLTVLDIAAVLIVAVKNGVNNTVTLGVSHEIIAVADQSAGGDAELQSCVAAADGTHV